MFDELIGKPFCYHGRGPRGFDCWTLAQEIASRVGRCLPTQETIVDEVDRAARIIDAANTEFTRLGKPKPFCLVLFWIRHRAIPEHIGTVLTNTSRFMHITEDTGVVISRLSDPFWSMRILGYYDYNARNP